MTDAHFLQRIAGAPITWGVDDAPGWGYLMDPDRVLDEMREAGLAATELGPDGYLADAPETLERMLGSRDLQLVGGFVPVRLYRRSLLESELASAARAADTLAERGAKTFVLGPASVYDGYDQRVEMSAADWEVFDDGLRRLREICEERGLVTALHSHWGYAVDRPRQIERVLESSTVDMCIDTGHIALAGGDPLEVARMAGERVAHVHLKDVDERLAEQVRAGEATFRGGVRRGLFRPLGEGYVDIAGLVRHLEDGGYRGWYVLEQDIALDGAPPPGTGPIDAARASMQYLADLAGLEP